MAFIVNLYPFSKRENSTARPSGDARAFSCVVKTGTGILRPTIQLDIGLNESPANYNYAYIPTFGRYYFIEEWYFSNRLWEAQLSVDVLATYREDIGAASLYVLRAANDWDGRIIDNLYPTKTGSTYDKTVMASPWILPASGGTYSLGIVSKGSQFGSINYYLFVRPEMRTFVNSLMTDIVTADNFDFDELGESLTLSIVDPMQYIKSAVFLPFNAIDGGAGEMENPTPVFNWDVNAASFKVNDPTKTFNYTFAIKKHPQTNSRGNYVNCSPYTNITLAFPPFGVVEIDTTVTCNASQLNVEIDIDRPTGLGIMTVKCNGIILNRVEAQIGIPIQLSQVTRDYLGAFNNVMGAASGIANGVGAKLSGNIAGAVGSAFGVGAAIGNAAASMVPRANSMGSGGSYTQLTNNCELSFQFFECVDDDITQNGRPLCEMTTPASLGGYMLIQDGDISTTGTAEENRSIRAYLEGGFYYE